LPSPNVNTHLPDFAALGAGLALALVLALVLALTAGFGAGLAELFFKALRAPADGVVLARVDTDVFDLAAVFLGLATALAMTYKQSARGDGMRALHHVWAVPRKARSSFQARYEAI
jgi:hypothetical protein